MGSAGFLLLYFAAGIFGTPPSHQTIDGMASYASQAILYVPLAHSVAVPSDIWQLGGNFALIGAPSIGASGAILGTIAVLWVDLIAHWQLEDRPKRKVRLVCPRAEWQRRLKTRPAAPLPLHRPRHCRRHWLHPKRSRQLCAFGWLLHGPAVRDYPAARDQSNEAASDDHVGPAHRSHPAFYSALRGARAQLLHWQPISSLPWLPVFVLFPDFIEQPLQRHRSRVHS